jgi:hypothetical protein
MNMTGVAYLREMMGARCVLCGPNNSPTDEAAKEILETEDYRLNENPNPMGGLNARPLMAFCRYKISALFTCLQQSMVCQFRMPP